MEPQTKEKVEGVLSRLGITPTEAFRVFYRQIALRGGLPFSVTIPNERTAATLRKSRRNQNVETFDSLDAMFESWQK
jgi:DNA-damage-inducible protein J